jgi:site-specific recombinase XerC
MRFLEFFAANIRNPHTRRAYARAAEEFLGWCASVGVRSIADVQPVHVATWIEVGTRELAAPSAKQRLAAIRHLFDWLVSGRVVPVNPAGSVRGPRHVITCGQTPVLDPAEARALLDSIDISRARLDQPPSGAAGKNVCLARSPVRRRFRDRRTEAHSETVGSLG